VATVTVAFTPLPAHVRTARFISASVARRAGVAENLLDEVRLAVSEACSLAVRLHLAHAPAEPVEVRLTEEADEFRIEVADVVARHRTPDSLDAVPDALLDAAGPTGRDGPGTAGDPSAVSPVAADAEEIEATIDDTGELVDLRARERIGLAVIAGLVDDFSVDYRDTGSVITMSWPIERDAVRASAGGPL
jgi:anti-sigma regulatory factor (Ser/Thr protein kinase)